MKSSQPSNKCYVFSQITIDTAFRKWIELMIKENPKKEELFLITKAAMPWFLKHIQQNPSVYMLPQEDLLNAIEQWKSIQIESYPNQTQRIEETCDLLNVFFQSDLVLGHKMIIEA